MKKTPPKPTPAPRQQVSIRLELALIRDIEQLSQADHRSWSGMAELLLHEALAARAPASKIATVPQRPTTAAKRLPRQKNLPT